MKITKKEFGKLNGEAVYSYTFTNAIGASATVLDYGGIVSSLMLPDRNGELDEVVCGFDNIEDYLTEKDAYFGAIVGRYCNRISGGGFALGGKRYELENNEGGRAHLHGGYAGLSRRIWSSEIKGDTLCLSTFSPHLEDGYPGNLSVSVKYSFDDDCVLTVNYSASSDCDTVLNLTSHTYFNLNGYRGRPVTEQELYIDADHYDEVDELMIPIGEPRSVEGTRYDFRALRPIREGYDHNFVLSDKKGTIRSVALLYDRESGRKMELYTDMPALQLYTGVVMNGKTPFRAYVPQRPLHALCLETQYGPDTPNRPYMPQCILRAGEEYRSTTKFVFSVD